MQIEIDIPRPVATIVTVIALAVAAFWVDAVIGKQAVHADAQGGRSRQEMVREAEAQTGKLREQQMVLQRREAILRLQLQRLREERARAGTLIHPSLEQELQRSEQMLMDLLRDQDESERLILLSLQQIWQAEGRAIAISRTTTEGDVTVTWPVEPSEGISAYFEDPAYLETFGMPHRAIDIPVPQSSPIVTAADGVVEDVSDNGLGFNSVTVRHNGFTTLYGHVESFLVEEGEKVRRGQPIALSGGRPGTPGAGHISTGPHLHFEVIKDGVRVDPLGYLPPLPSW